jgi:hypothetical protein
MTEHRLKSREENFLSIACGQKIDARLADRPYSPGDKVTFVRYEPKTNTEGQEVTVILTHATLFGPRLFAQRSDEELGKEYVLLGLSRPTELVASLPSNVIALKSWPENFAEIEKGCRVDLRINDKPYKHGSMLLFQEFNPETKQYTGKTATRQIKRITPWKPAEYYAPEQIRTQGIAVLGWKGLEQKV